MCLLWRSKPPADGAAAIPKLEVQRLRPVVPLRHVRPFDRRQLQGAAAVGSLAQEGSCELEGFRLEWERGDPPGLGTKGPPSIPCLQRRCAARPELCGLEAGERVLVLRGVVEIGLGATLVLEPGR